MAPVDPPAMTFGSLFAGIGGFDLGLERAGMVCKWQVEIDPFCRKVLTKHWPHVPKYEDVREVGAHNLERVDLLCGGFPCQDISSSGKKVGIVGAKSGLWRHFARVICELRPRYVLVENVAMLAARAGGLGVVLGDLASCGYDAEWESLPAGLFGAPHLRERIFVVGYTDGYGQPNVSVNGKASWVPPMVTNAEQSWREQRRTLERAWGPGQSIPWDENGECQDPTLAIRVDDGISHRMDRLRGLGNAVVPQIAEWLGRRILESVA